MPVPKAWYVNGHVLCIFLSALSAILFSSWVTFVYWRQSLVYLHPETQLFLRFVTLICHAVSQGLAKHWCGWTRRCLVCCYLGFIAQNKPCNSLSRIAEVCIPSLSVTGARKKKMPFAAVALTIPQSCHTGLQCIFMLPQLPKILIFTLWVVVIGFLSFHAQVCRPIVLPVS